MKRKQTLTESAREYSDFYGEDVNGDVVATTDAKKAIAYIQPVKTYPDELSTVRDILAQFDEDLRKAGKI